MSGNTSPRPRHSRPTGRRARYIQPFTLLVALSVALAFAALVATHTASPQQASSSPRVIVLPGGKHIACGLDGLPQCPVPQDWVRITSFQPGNIARTIVASQAFKMLATRYDMVDTDLPMVVHTLSPHATSDYFADDHWVASVRNARHVETGVIDFVFDSAHSRMRFAGFGAFKPGDAQYGHAFPFVSAQTAISRLGAERQMAVAPTSQPQLVFFQPDPQWIGPEAPHHWNSSGAFPSDPLWMVTGTNGVAYFIGSDQHVYTTAQIPFAAGTL